MTQRPFVFGSAYQRGLTPAREDWDRDMANMRAAGFNTIRAMMVWGTLEPRPGELDTGYFDQLLDTAARHGLTVGPLFHLHGCPEWLTRAYPQYWYVDIHGRPFEPSPRSNTPSGGWPGLCPDHPEVQELEADFIRRVATYVGDHPALAFWEPINEPHMWTDQAETPPGTFCYCPATRARFREWLRERHGDLDTLGEAWGRCFGEWDEVRPPTWKFGFSDWVDWRTFTAENIAALVARRTAVIQAHSAAPVMAHAWGGGCVTCSELGAMAFDDWKNAAPVQMWGYSAFPWNISQTAMIGLGTDATRCAARGKEFWQSELGAVDYSGGFERTGRTRPELQSLYCWESLRHGSQGLLFWQYRKEAHGSEMGAYGLTDYGGNPTELLTAVAQVGKVLNDHADLFHAASVHPAEVALLFSYRSYMADWSQYRNNKLSVDCLSGYYRIFWEANIPVDVLHEEFLDLDELARYRMIVLPNPAALAAGAPETLAEYVRRGGTILSDPYFCFFNADLSLAREMPGRGLAAVFGCQEGDVRTIHGEAVGLQIGSSPAEVSGSHFRAWWRPSPEAEVIATYDDGQAAVVSHAHGQGRAIISGLNLGLACSTRQGLGDDVKREGGGNEGADAAALVRQLAAEAGITAPVQAPPGCVASLLVTPDQGAVLIALNLRDEAVEADLALPAYPARSARDLIADQPVGREEHGELKLVFHPYESRVLWLPG
jgi:beta-galactosidase GanA